MKPLILFAALVALSALVGAKPAHPQRKGPNGELPAWLQQGLKPIVNKPVVTR